MRIKSIAVNNFKSLVDFKIDLAKFNCLIGLNGSGKSTFLQFVDFLTHLMKGDIDTWFKRRDWKTSDIYNHLDKKKSIDFTVEVVDDAGKNLTWKSRYYLKWGCRFEEVIIEGIRFYTFRKKNETRRHYGLWDALNKTTTYGTRINFKYQGSILSALGDENIPKAFYDFRDFIASMESFELLAPHFLRQRTRESEGSIGLEGKGLASFLHEMNEANRRKIVEQLFVVYPQLDSINIKKLRAGWKQIDIKEKFNETVLNSESRHVNDGMLRLIAILAQLQSNRRVIVFEEIENGIIPESVGFLLGELINTEKQVVVTTHSPIILNYLDDETAIPGVHFFYKTPEGFTQTVPFLSVPDMREKLEVMGPGEAFIDTNLTELANRLSQQRSASASMEGKER